MEDWEKGFEASYKEPNTDGTDGYFGDLARQFGQGVSFDFADEIEAGIRAPFSDRNYGQIVGDIRQQNDDFFKEHPVQAFGAQGVAGMVPLLGWANKGAKGFKLLKKGYDVMNKLPPKATGNVVKGIGEGALSGLGQTEDITDVSGTAKDVGLGGGVGGGVGSFTGVLGKMFNRFVDRPKDKMGRVVENAMDGWTPDELARETARKGEGAVLADATPDMRGSLQYAGNQPGSKTKVNQFLDDRQMGQSTELKRILTEATGESGDSFERRTLLNQKRMREADSLYQQNLYKHSIDPTDDMLGFLETKRGKAIASKVMSDLEMNPDNAGGSLEDMIQTAEFWDLATRRMKDASTNSVGKMKSGEFPILKKSKELSKQIDEQTNGALTRTRTRYKELMQDLGSIDSGKKFMSMTPADFDRKIQNMRPEEKNSLLSGMTEFLMGKIDSAPETANVAWNLVKSPGFKKKLKSIIGEEKANRYIEEMSGQAEQTLTRNATSQNTNSITGALDAYSDMFAANGVDAARAAVQGDFGQLAKMFAGHAGKRQPSRAETGQLADLMMTPAEGVSDALTEVTKRGKVAPELIPAIRRGANAARYQGYDGEGQ